MCRILAVRADTPFSIHEQLSPFANIARDSREYQGHGWGCAWLAGDRWRSYHNISPVWEDDLEQFEDTTLLVAHARSAFRDEGIFVENNMPFDDGTWQFIFNGELRGVRIKEEGRIGAEKIFNYIKRFEDRGKIEMVETGTRIINKRTRYVRAMNIIMSDGDELIVSSHFGEDPEYFQMQHTTLGNRTVICSEPWPDTGTWNPIDNGSTVAFNNPQS